MRKQFYEKLLPSQGVYCVTGITKNGDAHNRFAENLAEVFTIIDAFVGEESNVFVAPSTFKSYSRKSDNVAYTRSFFVDLDVDAEDPKKYATKDEAVAALKDFVRRVGLPPPVLVDSGGGVHAYWIFQQDLTPAEWKPYAEKFKAFCRENGLKIDPVVTADIARIMRAPVTFNHKTEPPTPTGFIDDLMYQYDFQAFKDFLGEVEESQEDILAGIARGLDEDTLKIAKMDNFESVFQTIAEKSLEDQGCAQIKYILLNSQSLSEPLWHSGLSIARHCTDWETAIHLMSEDYPGYSASATEKKANETIGKPHSCATFEDRNPGGCDGCPFKGKITNPLSIGRRLIEAPQAEPAVEADAVRANEDTEAVPVFPAFLKPFVRGVNGGVYYLPPPKRDEEGKPTQEAPVCLSLNDLYPVKRVYHKTTGETLIVRYVLPKDPLREFELPVRSVSAQDEMLKILGNAGLLIGKNDAPKMQEYWRKWTQYLQSIDGAENMHMQMGWTEHKDAFVIGTNEITDKGEIRKAAASPLIRNVSKLLVPVGDYDIWKRSANFLNTPGYEFHAFGLMCGLGSPFMTFTSTSGVSVSFTSTGSSHGKTGAMYAGISVWGHPKELSVLEGNSTDNAYIGRYLNLKNMAFGMDEAGAIGAENLSKLIHRISQGKAKMRMQTSTNAERDLELTASLIAIFTNNHSLYEKLTTLKERPDGELARLVEFVLPKPPGMTGSLGMEIFNPLRSNYGWAGIELMQHYFKRGEGYVQDLILKWQLRFKETFGDDSMYRFYENLIAATFTGTELAIEAGIVDLDLERIFSRIVSELMVIRDGTAKASPADYRALIGEFVNEHGQNFLILNDGKIVSEPRFKIVGRTEIENGVRYISTTAFKNFILERGLSIREFKNTMKAEKVMVYDGKKRLAVGWKAGADASAVAVYGFKADIQELIDESKA